MLYFYIIFIQQILPIIYKYVCLNSGTSGRKRGRGPSAKLGGVSVNAKSLLACEKELEPLDIEIPLEPSERNKWVLDVR